MLRESSPVRIVPDVKVVIHQKTNSTWDAAVAELQKEFPDVIFVAGLPQAADHVEDADVIVSTNPGRDTIARGVGLKLVIVPITGVDHVPLDILAERGIRLANAHGNARYVAERTIAMILAYYGRIIEFHNDLANEERWHGFWVRQGLEDSWRTIHGRTVSILGAGEIGHHIARYTKTFDTTNIGFKKNRIEGVPEFYDRIVYDLNEAIDLGDVVVIALPSTPGTQGLISKDRIAIMKGKLLVNIGRGDILDQEALYHGLREGSPAGAAIDAWWQYPQRGEVTGAPARYPIHKLPNVVVSPHLAGYVGEAMTASIQQTSENLRRFLTGRELLTEVDPSLAY